MQNLQDELDMYRNRIIEADSEVIYLKNTLQMKENEAKMINLAEKFGAYKNLESRFVESMRKNAEQQDEIDQLQHVIMQLQGETETIGELFPAKENLDGSEQP